MLARRQPVEADDVTALTRKCEIAEAEKAAPTPT